LIYEHKKRKDLERNYKPLQITKTRAVLVKEANGRLKAIEEKSFKKDGLKH
jgi:hypothetical protein